MSSGCGSKACAAWPGMAQQSSREERLAAKLRENLRRRKAQARALADETAPQEPASAQNESGALSNGSPES
jgi:hypothetical protein